MTPSAPPLPALPWTMETLHPPGTAYAPRTRAEALAWVALAPNAPDTVTGLTLSFAGAMPVVAHSGMAGDAARRLLAAGGLTLAAELIAYRTEDEAVAAVRRLAAEGFRIASTYPLPTDWVAPADLLVDPDLTARLNDKARLADWVPEDLLPQRRVLPTESLGSLDEPFAGEPVVLKVATRQANGAAGDVALCPTGPARVAALRRFQAAGHPFHALVVERMERFERIWSAGFGLLDERTIPLGATLHLRDAQGLQAGSLAGGEALPAALGERLAAIAEGWRRAGYRGIAGLDVGRTADGRFLVFDLNVRLNASSGHLLLHGPLAAARGAACSISFFQQVAETPDRLATQALPWVRDGHLLVTRLADLSDMVRPERATALTGLVFGEDEADCHVIARYIAEALA